MALEPITTISSVRHKLALSRHSGQIIGLVPTMGALHAGHGALIERARRESDHLVVSIFVNPIQFNQHADYEAYAIDLGRDLAFCEQRGVDLVFAPSPEEMYPTPQTTFVEVAEVSEHLCGKFRPGHFRGVATVVAKLLNIIGPDKAFFGEKDAQQLAVIQRMVKDLDIPVEIVPVATVREADGLALSSRNQRLTPDQRRVAPLLFKALQDGRSRIAAGCVSAVEIREAVMLQLQNEPTIRVEYVEVVDPIAMKPVEQITGAVRIAAAVWLGSVRLIDNVYCTPLSISG